MLSASSKKPTLYTSHQSPHQLRDAIAGQFGMEKTDLRVVCVDVGGSFGMKAAPFPEYVCVLHAARALGRPVKWTDERSGSFVSDSHGRDHEKVAELAARLGAGFVAHRVQLGEGEGLEDRARRARRAVLPAGAATGHTMERVYAELVRLHRDKGLDFSQTITFRCDEDVCKVPAPAVIRVSPGTARSPWTRSRWCLASRCCDCRPGCSPPHSR